MTTPISSSMHPYFPDKENLQVGFIFFFLLVSCYSFSIWFLIYCCEDHSNCIGKNGFFNFAFYEKYFIFYQCSHFTHFKCNVKFLIEVKAKKKGNKINCPAKVTVQPALLLSSFVHNSSINELKNMKLSEHICYEMINWILYYCGFGNSL